MIFSSWPKFVAKFKEPDPKNNKLYLKNNSFALMISALIGFINDKQLLSNN